MGKWGGWIAFAGWLMIIIGLLDFFQGLIAIIRKEYYALTSSGVIVFDVRTWGWITLLWAVIIGLTGLGLLNGSSWARWTAIVLISINFLSQLGFAGSAAYPLWALTVQILNLVVLYALTVHWNGTREPAYASSSA